MEQQEKNEWAQQEQEIQEGLKGKSFWYADWGFPILVGIMSAAIFAGTHMYVVYGVGAFNEVSIVAMLKAGLDGGSYGAAAAFGASFLFFSRDFRFRWLNFNGDRDWRTCNFPQHGY